MLGGQAMEAAGYQTADQIRNEKIMEIRQQFPNPTTDADFRQIGNAFNNIGETEYAEKAFDQIKDTGTSVKKWSFEQLQKRQAIRREAERRGYNLTESDIDDIAISTPLATKLHPMTGKPVHPWMDQLELKLSSIEKGGVTQTAETPSTFETPTSKEIGKITDTKALEDMTKLFNAEIKGSKDNITTAKEGIDYVSQHRSGNPAALPQISKLLAKMNADNRLSVPEVQHVMKFGGLGDRITRSFSTWISGNIPPDDLKDIEDMFVRLGRLGQDSYETKRSQYKIKYSNRFKDEQLNTWLPSSTDEFLTRSQLLERAKEEARKRGLK